MTLKHIINRVYQLFCETSIIYWYSTDDVMKIVFDKTLLKTAEAVRPPHFCIKLFEAQTQNSCRFVTDKVFVSILQIFLLHSLSQQCEISFFQTNQTRKAFTSLKISI